MDSSGKFLRFLHLSRCFMSIHSLKLSVSIVFFICSFLVKSQDTVLVFPEIVISNPKFVSSPASKTFLTQTITESQIQAQQPQHVAELTRNLAGVQVKDYGGLGGVKTVSVRGLNAGHTLVLVDGFPFLDVTSGQADLGLLNIDNIKNITLTKGNPLKAGISAQAYQVANVLEIKSKLAAPLEKDTLCFMLKYQVSSFSTHQFSTQIIQKLKRFQYGFSSNYQKTDGNFPFEYKNGQYSGSYSRENAFLRRFWLQFHGMYQLSNNSKVHFQYNFLNSNQGLPGAVVDYTQKIDNGQNLNASQNRFALEYENVSFSKLNFWWRNYLEVFKTNYTDPNFANSAGGLDQDFRQINLNTSFSTRYLVSKSSFIDFSTDFIQQKLYTDQKLKGNPERILQYATLTYNLDLKRFIFHMNASSFYAKDINRLNSDTYFKILPTASITFQPIKAFRNFKIHSFYKETYRLPNFTESYYARLSPTALRPEQAKQMDVGVSFEKLISAWSFTSRVDVYKIYLKDKIVFIPSQNLFIWSVRNIGKVETTGLDYILSIENKSMKWSPMFSVGYSFNKSVDKTDVSSSLYNNQIAYIPVHTAYYSVSFKIKKWNFNFNSNYTGQRYFLNENKDQNQLPSYFTYDFALSYQLKMGKSNLLTSFAIKNFTNTSYEVVHAFPMPGRVFQASLKFEI